MNRVQVEIVVQSVIEVNGFPYRQDVEDGQLFRLHTIVEEALKRMKERTQHYLLAVCLNGPDTAMLSIDYIGDGVYCVRWYYDDSEGSIWTDDTNLGEETHFSWTAKLIENGIELTQDTDGE